MYLREAFAQHRDSKNFETDFLDDQVPALAVLLGKYAEGIPIPSQNLILLQNDNGLEHQFLIYNELEKTFSAVTVGIADGEQGSREVKAVYSFPSIM